MSERATSYRPASRAGAATPPASSRRAASTGAASSPSFTFAAPKSALSDALARVGGMAKQSRLLPILQAVLIEATRSADADAVPAVTLRTTDLERWVTTQMPTTALSGAGKVALPVEKLTKIIASLPAGVVTITVSGVNATITAGRTRCQLVGLPADEWPAHSANTANGFAPSARHVVDAKKFTDALARVAPHAAANSTTQALCGALLESDAEGLTLVACDRINLMRVGIGAATDTPLSVIIPREAFPLVTRLFGDDESLTLEIGAQECRITGARSALLTRAIEGPYPAYRPLLRQPPTLTVTTNRAELIAAVKRCQLTAEHDLVVLRFAEHDIALESWSPDAGESEDHVEASRIVVEPGAVRRLAVGGDHFRELLESVPGTEITLQLTGDAKPVYLRDASSESASQSVGLHLPRVFLDERQQSAKPSTAATSGEDE